MKISVIIVNWNGKHWLKKSIPALYRSNVKNFEVVVVDNGSSDGSEEYIRRYYPQVKLVRLGRNVGFAAANNVGYKSVSGGYIYFLNNDAIVRKDTLSKLASYLDKNVQVGGVQSKIFSLRHKNRLDSAGSFLTNTGFLFHYGYLQKDGKKYAKTLDIFSAKGASMMFKRKVINKTGLFDDAYFAYFEESDFCHRVWLAGYSVKYFPAAAVDHWIGATSNRIDSSFIQFHAYKNRIRSYLKNLGTAELIKILPVHVSLALGIATVMFLKGNRGVSVSIIRALLWNVYMLPGTLRKRKIVQRRIRTRSDNDFLPVVHASVGYRYYMSQLFKNHSSYREPTIA